jgi:hypothetical protein
MRRVPILFLIAGITLVAASCADPPQPRSDSAAGAGPSEKAPANPCGPDADEEGSAVEGSKAPEDATIHDVTAVEYEFQGAPTRLAAGPHGFRLVSAGEEFHELALVRVDSDQPVSDLLELPEDEQAKVMPYIGGVTACPGETSPDAVGGFLQPGRYALLCFVPTGTRPDLRGKDLLAAYENPPHFTHGMVAEILVG